MERQMQKTRTITKQGMDIEVDYLFAKDTNADGQVTIPIIMIIIRNTDDHRKNCLSNE